MKYNKGMEIDMDKSHWYSNKCPQYDCRKKSCNKCACECGLKYVNIPITMGDNSDGSPMAPKNGAYCNAIVKYEANGAVYIYSAEGIPTLLTTDISPSISRRLYDLEAEVVRLRNELVDKQHVLTAGENITIENNVISSTGGSNSNLVIELPNDVTTYTSENVPLRMDDALEAMEAGRSIFFIYNDGALEDVYMVSSIQVNDGVWSMKVDRASLASDTNAGFWIVRSDNPGRWDNVRLYHGVHEDEPIN